MRRTIGSKRDGKAQLNLFDGIYEYATVQVHLSEEDRAIEASHDQLYGH